VKDEKLVFILHFFYFHFEQEKITKNQTLRTLSVEFSSAEFMLCERNLTVSQKCNTATTTAQKNNTAEYETNDYC